LKACWVQLTLRLVFRKVKGSAVRNVTSDVGSDSALLLRFGAEWPAEDAQLSSRR